MLVYIVTFTLSSLLVQAAASPAIKSRAGRILLSALPVAIMSWVAAIRDYGVGGPDALVYGNSLFVGATQAADLEDVITFATRLGIDGDPAYALLNFIVSRFSDDPHVFYFWLSMLSSGIVLTAVMLMREYGPAGLMWLASSRLR